MASPAACVSALTCVALLAGAVQYAAGGQDRPQPPPPEPRATDGPATRAELAAQLTRTRNRLQQAERRARILERTLRHDPTVGEAIRLASVIYRVPEGTLIAVARCESGLRPTAENPVSTAGGLYQFLHWDKTTLGAAGFSRHSPYAQAFQAADWIRSRGLAPWYASRGCWGAR